MDLLLLLTYTAICIVIFKEFNVPLNKWTVPTAGLGGVILIGALVLMMNYNHPYSNMAREFYRLDRCRYPIGKGRLQIINALGQAFFVFTIFRKSPGSAGYTSACANHYFAKIERAGWANARSV